MSRPWRWFFPWVSHTGTQTHTHNKRINSYWLFFPISHIYSVIICVCELQKPFSVGEDNQDEVLRMWRVVQMCCKACVEHEHQSDRPVASCLSHACYCSNSRIGHSSFSLKTLGQRATFTAFSARFCGVYISGLLELKLAQRSNF